MKKILFVSLFLLAVPLAARAEQMNSLDAHISISADASIRVRERIEWDFQNVYRHGIFRDIPYRYKARGGNFSLRIKVLGVTDDNGDPVLYSVSKSGGFVRVKIGDADATVTGIRPYILEYTVERAMNFFSTHDELYWNVTGNGWQVPIGLASAEVSLPKEISAQSMRYACFVGAYGSREQCKGVSFSTSPSGSTGKFVFSQPGLKPSEGLTIVVGLPKGIVAEPPLSKKIQDTVRDNWVLGVPALVLALMYLLWKRKGKDPSGFTTVVAQYEPPRGLTPSEVGAIVDGSVSGKDITAAIMDLAVQGYIQITRLEEKILLFTSIDYRLDLLKSYLDLPKTFQQRLCNGLFQNGTRKSVKLSDLKNHFYKDLAEIKTLLYKDLVREGFYEQNPLSMKSAFIVLAIVVAMASVWLGAIFGYLTAIAGLVSATIILAFGWFMPKRTVKGAETKSHIDGLKLYMNVVEKDRIAFHSAPEKTPQIFEKLLPFAMVLGVEQAWAKQFEGIYNSQPNWYKDTSGRAFTASYLASGLGDFRSAAGASLTSSPSSSASGGSGFSGGGSGGGGGGGGGGSW